MVVVVRIFFENKDSDFLEHKNNLSINLRDLAKVIERSPFGKTGYIKELSSYIGNGDLGEMYIRVTPGHQIAKNAC